MENKKFLSLFVPFLTATLFLGSTIHITNSALPVYLSFLEVDLNAIGIYTMVFSLTALLFRPVAGWSVNKNGAAPTVLYGICAYLFVFTLYLFISNPTAILIGRVIQGAGVSLVSTALGSLVLGILPPDKLTDGLGYFGLANSVAQTGGLALGLQLISGGQYANLFVAGLTITAVALVIIIILTKMLSKETEPAEIEVMKQIDPNSSKLTNFIKNPVLLPALMVVLMMFSQSSVISYLSFLGNEKGMMNVSFFFLTNVAGVILARILLSTFLGKFGYIRTIFLSGGLYASGFLMLVLFSGVPAWVIISLVFGTGYGIFYTLLSTEAMKNVAKSERGTANALFYGGMDIGFSLGSLSWGIVADAVSVSSVFLGAGSMVLVATLGTARNAQRGKKAEEKLKAVPIRTETHSRPAIEKNRT